MTTTISLSQFLSDPGEAVRLVGLGLTVMVMHGEVTCFTVTPANR